MSDQEQSAVLTQLAEMAELPAGWDSYDADPISSTALALARDLVDKAPEPPDHIAPLADGGVLLGWRGIMIGIEVEAKPEGTYTYMVTDLPPRSRAYETLQDLSLKTIVHMLRGFIRRRDYWRRIRRCRA